MMMKCCLCGGQITTEQRNDVVNDMIRCRTVYRFAGNSVVVDCFAAILDEIVKDMENPTKGIDEW